MKAIAAALLRQSSLPSSCAKAANGGCCCIKRRFFGGGGTVVQLSSSMMSRPSPSSIVAAAAGVVANPNSSSNGATIATTTTMISKPVPIPLSLVMSAAIEKVTRRYNYLLTHLLTYCLCNANYIHLVLYTPNRRQSLPIGTRWQWQNLSKSETILNWRMVCYCGWSTIWQPLQIPLTCAESHPVMRLLWTARSTRRIGLVVNWKTDAAFRSLRSALPRRLRTPLLILPCSTMGIIQYHHRPKETRIFSQITTVAQYTNTTPNTIKGAMKKWWKPTHILRQ